MARLERAARGSTLLVVIIVLAVMAIAAAAALTISSREREAASFKGKYDALRACGEAASRRIWAEVALTNGEMIGGVWGVSLPGGPKLNLGHYDDTFTSVDVSNEPVVREKQGPAAASGGIKDVDTTNTFRAGIGDSSGYTYFAHCTDLQGQQYEVELFARFGL